MSEGQIAALSNAWAKDSDIKLNKYKADSIPEQDFIHYTAVPSLESIALVNVVVQLWKHADFREEMMNHVSEFGYDYSYAYYKKGRFKEISKGVSEKLSLLPLPYSLKQRARNVITPIGVEVMNWLTDIEKCQWHWYGRIDLLCFTMKGTIDKARTLELLVGKMELGDIFNKACEYCLDDRIADLWEQMPRETRENSFYTRDIFQGYGRHLVAYWVCFLKNELPKLMGMIEPTYLFNRNQSIYRNMFRLSISESKASAAKYFWYKLTDGERNSNVVEGTCLVIDQTRGDYSNEYSDIMFFLLSQLNDTEQQRQLFHKHGAIVLRSLLLGFPWRKFLLPKLQSIWDNLESGAYISVLTDILEQKQISGMDEQLFGVLWCNTPKTFRKHFIRYISTPITLNIHPFINMGYPYCIVYCCALSALFAFEDTELVKLVLNDADVEERKLIFHNAVESHEGVLYDLIYRENVPLLEILIGEYLVSECEIKKFKADKMLEYGDELCCDWIKRDNWRAVEKMLDWAFDSQDQVDALKAKIVDRIRGGSCLGEIGTGKWSSFEGFINWCFNSVEEVNQFKMDISPDDRMETFIRHIIKHNRNIEFLQKFVVWCFSSEKEIVRFKKKLMFSHTGLEMCSVLVGRGLAAKDDSGYVKMLSEWFHPFGKEVLSLLKLKKEQYFRYPRIDWESLNCFFSLLDSFIHGGEIDSLPPSSKRARL